MYPLSLYWNDGNICGQVVETCYSSPAKLLLLKANMKTDWHFTKRGRSLPPSSMSYHSLYRHVSYICLYSVHLFIQCYARNTGYWYRGHLACIYYFYCNSLQAAKIKDSPG